MTMAWKRLQHIYDDLIRAMHARHVHARGCKGCNRCRVVEEAVKKARADYDASLREYIG